MQIKNQLQCISRTQYRHNNFKIKRKKSPNCSFCGTMPETIIHLFCECDIVTPLWYDLLQVILVKHDNEFSLDNFKKILELPLTNSCLFYSNFFYILFTYANSKMLDPILNLLRNI